MRSLRVLAGAGLFVALGSVAYFAEEQAPLGSRMADKASQFLETLSEDQKAKCSIAFDDKERTNWIFVPMNDKARKPTRKGLRLEEMSEKQQQAALELLKTGTSESGYKQAVTIMSLEGILQELEKNGPNVRNPAWYFLTVFGEPARTGKWGWRIEGHHLSLNFTIVDGQVASATPAFFGANPAEVRTGDRKGDRVLKDVEDSARELFQSLDDDQKSTATQPKHFGEPSQYIPAEKVGKAVGLSAAKLNEKQQGMLKGLLKAYTARMPAAVADAQWKKVTDGGWDEVYFAYTGGTKSGEPHTYRIQGPAFIVQFLNAQEDAQKNAANHIHSAWRELPSDFGLR
jgi:hypothetical protein